MLNSRNTNVPIQSTRSDRTQTSLQRKISRYQHDPIRFERGGYDEPAEYLKLGAIKAVRLG